MRLHFFYISLEQTTKKRINLCTLFFFNTRMCRYGNQLCRPLAIVKKVILQKFGPETLNFSEQKIQMLCGGVYQVDLNNTISIFCKRDIFRMTPCS